MGDALDLARRDSEFILSQGGFETDVVFEKDTTSITVSAVAMKHHLSFDFEGKPMNSQNAHITVHNETLKSAGVSDTNLLGWKVTYADSTGISASYKIVQQFPDNTIGLTTFMIANYE